VVAGSKPTQELLFFFFLLLLRLLLIYAKKKEAILTYVFAGQLCVSTINMAGTGESGL
jgi:hypothetical protein